MKMFVPLAAALLFAGPAAAQSSHAAHHPAGKPPVPAMSDDKGCKMDEMSGNMEQMKQMHQQMMGQMMQMMQMMQSMQQQHQGMGMAKPKSTPPTDDKPH